MATASSVKAATNPQCRGFLDSEFVVAAADALHERMPGTPSSHAGARSGPVPEADTTTGSAARGWLGVSVRATMPVILSTTTVLLHAADGSP